MAVDPTLSPNLGIQLMAENVLEKEIIFNEAVLTLDALFKGTVLDTINDPPAAAPDPGSAYIVGTNPTGAFVGQANSIVFFYNGYQFITPPRYYRVFDVKTGSFLDFDGNVWSPVPAAEVTHLTDLLDVSAGGPADGAVLAFSSTSSKWIAGTVKFPVQTFAGLSDVSVADGASGQFVRLGPDGKTFVLGNLPSYPTQVSLLTQLSDYDGGKAVDASDGYVASWSKSLKKLTFVDPTTLITVRSLEQVGDISYGSGPKNGDQLTWNGASWGPSSRNTVFSFLQMVDGPRTFDGKAKQFMVVNDTEDALVFEDIGTLLQGSTIKLQNLGDVPNPIGSTGQALVVNSAGTGFVYSSVAGYIRVQHAESDVDTMVRAISFDGNVTVTDGANGLVIVSFPTPPAPYTFTSNGTTYPAPTGLDFEGNVSVAEANGILTLTFSGGSLASLSDVAIPSPTDGSGLVYDAPSKKWVPRSVSAQLMNVQGVASPNTYELGPFAPPASNLFPTNVQGQDVSVQSIANRGMLLIPANQAGTATLVHTLRMSQTPYSITCRVAVSPGDDQAMAGITIARASTNRQARLGQNDGTITFDYQTTADASNTQVAQVSKDWKWLRLSYDGTNIIAFAGKDGITWTRIGSVSAATALGGVPDQVGLFSFSSSGNGTGDALFTFYEDPDYPATARTTYGYLTGSIAACTDVDLSIAPTDGQALVWNDASKKFKPGSVASTSGAATGTSSSISTAQLTDVDESTPPTNGQVLVFDGASQKFKPGNVASASSSPSSSSDSGPYGAHKFWRFTPTATNANRYITYSELEFRAQPNGPSIVGTTITDGSHYGNNVADNAFDLNTATYYEAPSNADGAGIASGKYWVGLQYSVAKSIVEIAIRGTGDTNELPTKGNVDYSDDGTTWTTAWVINPLNLTADTAQHVYTSPDYGSGSGGGASSGSSARNRGVYNTSGIFGFAKSLPSGFTFSGDAVQPTFSATRTDANAADTSGSLHFPKIGANQTTSLTYTTTSDTPAGNWQVRYLVSSERNFDFVRFFLDNTEVPNTADSGTTETDFVLFSTPLTAGVHTLVMRYSKDGSSDVGDDTVYLSQVSVPLAAAKPYVFGDVIATSNGKRYECIVDGTTKAPLPTSSDWAQLGPAAIADLSDIDFSTPPTGGQALIYDATKKKFTPVTPAASGGGSGGGSGGPSYNGPALAAFNQQVDAGGVVAQHDEGITLAVPSAGKDQHSVLSIATPAPGSTGWTVDIAISHNQPQGLSNPFYGLYALKGSKAITFGFVNGDGLGQQQWGSVALNGASYSGANTLYDRNGYNLVLRVEYLVAGDKLNFYMSRDGVNFWLAYSTSAAGGFLGAVPDAVGFGINANYATGSTMSLIAKKYVATAT